MRGVSLSEMPFTKAALHPPLLEVTVEYDFCLRANRLGPLCSPDGGSTESFCDRSGVRSLPWIKLQTGTCDM